MISGLSSVPLGDLAIVGFLFAFFIFGVVSGAIRSGLGSLVIVFAFLVAANIRGPLGDYLIQNWHQFPDDYSRMIGFLVVFILLGIIGLIVVGGFSKRMELSAANPMLDDVIGGFMGLLQGVLLLFVAVVIFGSYKSTGAFYGEIDQLRWFHDLLLNQSSIGPAFRDHVVPIVFQLIGGLLPTDLVKLFP